jgi:hypothetical protein
MSDIFYNAELGRKRFEGSELDFIRMEISLALAFLDRADTTENPEVRNRNRENAQKAHDEAASRIAGHSFENTAAPDANQGLYGLVLPEVCNKADLVSIHVVFAIQRVTPIG